MSVLELDSLSVRFGGHLAVSDVSLTVEGGRVSGLIGPNGAGKTTTFNAICGVVNPSAGRVRLGGKDITRVGTHKRARLGIGRTFQRLEVFSSLTVRENIQVGLEIRRSWSRTSVTRYRTCARAPASSCCPRIATKWCRWSASPTNPALPSCPAALALACPGARCRARAASCSGYRACAASSR